MSRILPEHPSLEHLKKQAKELLRAVKLGAPDALERFSAVGSAADQARTRLSNAQHVLAREYGFANWARLKAHVESAGKTTNPAEALSEAVRGEELTRVQATLDRHPELRARLNDALPGMPFGGTALLSAVHAGNRPLIDLLLEAGADINGRSHWWAGSFGVLDNDGDLAPFLIERGATVDAYAASRLGMTDRLQELVSRNPELVHARGGDGQTPLHVAANVEIARYLVEHGADLDARDIDHESTPAQYLIRSNQAVVRYLLEAGASSDILMASALGDLERVRRYLDQNPTSIRTSVSPEWFPMRDPRAGGTVYIWTLGGHKTAHEIAREFGHNAVVQLLLDRSPDELKLALACQLGDERLFRVLMDQRPDLVRTLTDDDHRKLASAAERNNTNAVRLMLEAGWPLDGRGNDCGTALHWAAWHGNATMVREILKYRPPVDIRGDAHDATPLGWALHGSQYSWHRKTGDHVAVVEALLQAGARPIEIPSEIQASEGLRGVLDAWAKRHKPKPRG